MGKQHNKVEKRSRKTAYLKRKAKLVKTAKVKKPKKA